METQIQVHWCEPHSCLSGRDRLLRATAVARRIGRTPRMVRYLAEARLLIGFKRGKLWFFKEADVLAFIVARDGAYVQ
jgi:hypothetical protein